MRHFLQSADWADFFHESLGTKVLRHNGNSAEFTAFIERSYGKVGKLLKRLYVPYGPYIDTAKKLPAVLKEVEELGTQQGVDYIRVEPIGVAIDPAVMEKHGYVKRHKPSQPEQTSILDITGKTEEVLGIMGASIRNRWKANKNKGLLTFETSFEAAKAAPLINMMKITADRLGLVFHEAEYTKKMVEVLGPRKFVALAYA